MTSGEDSLASLPAATGPSSADKTAHGSGKKRLTYFFYETTGQLIRKAAVDLLFHKNKS